MVWTLGIPILVVAGVTRHRRWRGLIALVMLALVVAIKWSLDAPAHLDPAGLALLPASFVVAVGAIMAWGPRSAWSWIVAALSYQAMGGLRDAVYGPEWQARGAGALTVLVATGLIALVLRRALRSTPRVSAVAPTE
jgi:hypothetical protein